MPRPRSTDVKKSLTVSLRSSTIDKLADLAQKMPDAPTTNAFLSSFVEHRFNPEQAPATECGHAELTQLGYGTVCALCGERIR